VDGTALERVLQNPLARTGAIHDLALSLPAWFFKLATWGGLALELSFAPLALFRVMRPVVWGVMLLTLVLSIPLRDGPTSDVSWLITMCERILHGERAYVDIFENTPPFPMLLYMPGVVLAQLTGFTPEAVTFGFAYASALISLGISARILPDYIADGGQSKWLVLMPAAIVLFILPRDVFAQREWFAAAFTLPIVSVFVHHAHEGKWPPLLDRVSCAILAGLAMAIKPPLFALPIIFVAGYYWSRTKDLSFLVRSGLLTAGLIGLAVTAITLGMFPDYLGDTLTVMRDIYVPLRSDTLAFMNDKGCFGVLLCLMVALALSAMQRPPVTAVLAMVAALGFVAAYFIQGKFLYYHIFPAALFSGIAAFIVLYGWFRALAGGQCATLVGAIGASLSISIISILFVIGFDDRRPVMSDLSWAAGLGHPRALAVSADIRTSFPLARQIGAIWVDRIYGQWVAWFTRFALQSPELTEPQRTRYLYYHERDLEWIVRQISEKAPDIIFQDVRPSSSWLSSELAALNPRFLDGYEVIAEEGGTRVLRRRSAGRR
jgi:hypothetical protein